MSYTVYTSYLLKNLFMAYTDDFLTCLKSTLWQNNVILYFEHYEIKKHFISDDCPPDKRMIGDKCVPKLSVCSAGQVMFKGICKKGN